MSYLSECLCCGGDGVTTAATREEPGSFACRTCESGECRRCDILGVLEDVYLDAKSDPDTPGDILHALNEAISEIEGGGGR